MQGQNVNGFRHVALVGLQAALALILGPVVSDTHV